MKGKTTLSLTCKNRRSLEKLEIRESRARKKCNSRAQLSKMHPQRKEESLKQYSPAQNHTTDHQRGAIPLLLWKTKRQPHNQHRGRHLLRRPKQNRVKLEKEKMRGLTTGLEQDGPSTRTAEIQSRDRILQNVATHLKHNSPELPSTV